jgi:hypothetical protein
MIHTKLVEVVSKKADNDNIIISRQDILKMLYLTPEVCKVMYINQESDGVKYVILITHDEPNVKWKIGVIQSKYYQLLDKSYFKIMAWRITGGQNLKERANGSMMKAYFGMNISIKIVSEKKELILTEQLQEQTEDEQQDSEASAF